jgi:D-arabinose 1-dehydrogenase-like Zn-dependent alcohol dehydrogenase
VTTTPGLLIGRRLRIAGSGSATFEDLRQALALLASGAVKPIIAANLKFSDAARGHALMDQKALAGRVLMQGW